MIAEGLCDLQVNGFAGVDFNDDRLTAEGLDHALRAMLATGVTQCLPTLITAHPGELAARFAALDAAVAQSRLGPAMVPGYHLEGPHLSPREGFRGCHPPGAMGPADLGLLDRLRAGLSRPIRLVTLAPEVEGAVAYVVGARARGLAVALGHTAAGAAAVGAAAAAGATLSTHLGNGVAHQLHKFDNPLWAQLAHDGLVATFIADGIHVPPAALGVMLRAKGPGRALLVTDAVSAAAAAPGPHPFAGMVVERAADGSVRLPGAATLAGSSLTLDDAVRNVAAWGLAPWEAALAMAAAGPRAAAGLPGQDARVEWEGGRVVASWLAGERFAA